MDKNYKRVLYYDICWKKCNISEFLANDISDEYGLLIVKCNWRQLYAQLKLISCLNFNVGRILNYNAQDLLDSKFDPYKKGILFVTFYRGEIGIHNEIKIAKFIKDHDMFGINEKKFKKALKEVFEGYLDKEYFYSELYLDGGYFKDFYGLSKRHSHKIAKKVRPGDDFNMAKDKWTCYISEGYSMYNSLYKTIQAFKGNKQGFALVKLLTFESIFKYIKIFEAEGFIYSSVGFVNGELNEIFLVFHTKRCDPNTLMRDIVTCYSESHNPLWCYELVNFALTRDTELKMDFDIKNNGLKNAKIHPQYVNHGGKVYQSTFPDFEEISLV